MMPLAKSADRLCPATALSAASIHGTAWKNALLLYCCLVK